MSGERWGGGASLARLTHDELIRLEAVIAAARHLSPEGNVHAMLIHAAWIERYINTGLMPEIESAGPAPVPIRDYKEKRSL